MRKQLKINDKNERRLYGTFSEVQNVEITVGNGSLKINISPISNVLLRMKVLHAGPCSKENRFK